jgi:translocation and assembly module TamA
VIGGDMLAQASVELERRIIGRWSMAVFADAGDAFERDHPPDLGELKVGTGLGLRWLSPIGLVRADVAAAVSEPGTPIRFHLSIGPDL